MLARGREQERQSLLWVRNGPSATPPGRSAPEGEADEIDAKADIADGMSEAGGIPDLNRAWPSGPNLANSGRSVGSLEHL